jgi:hypothetical protein
LPKITGTLVDMSAAPVASAAVVAFGTQTGVPSLPACTTNGSGQFAVSVLPNQTYQVLATPPSTVFPPIAPQLLASAAAVAQADVSLGTVALRAGCTLSGKLIVQSAIDPTLDLIAIGYRQIQGGVCLPYTAGVAHGITPQGNYFFTVLPAP